MVELIIAGTVAALLAAMIIRAVEWFFRNYKITVEPRTDKEP
ncbi:MAG: hypothetical protein AAFR65_12720 [Pseudomonadota bacterium]